MNLAITICVYIVDISVLIACALSIVHAIPIHIEAAKWKRVLAWFGYGALTILPIIWKSDFITIPILTIYYLLIGWLFYFRIKMGVVCQIVYTMVLFATQYMARYTAQYIQIAMQLERGVFLYVLELLKCTLLISGTLLLRLLIRKRFKDVPYMKVHGMVIIPIFSLIIMLFFIIGSEMFLAMYGYYWILIIGALLIIMNLYCLYFWYDVAKNSELKHRLELMQQQNGLTAQYYAEMEKSYNKSRKIIHDIRNHLSAIEQKYRLEDRGYLEDIHEMLNSLGMKFYTDNRMLNIVLNDKLKALPPECVDCNLGGINLDFLTDMDITTIFANLLGNAVEAGKGRDDFQLRIRGEEIQDFIIVKISNPLYTNYEEGESAKPGHKGIGLGNVRQAVEKYKGEMDIQVKNDIFAVTVLFGKKNVISSEKTQGKGEKRG